MKAFIKFANRNGVVAANRKENNFLQEISALCPKTGDSIVSLRLYGTDKMAYACIWAHGTVYNSGGGRAGGCGYHRPSAAAEAAICDAGFNLSESIGGVGQSAMEKAVLAIAQAVTGRKKFFIHVAHG